MSERSTPERSAPCEAASTNGLPPQTKTCRGGSGRRLRISATIDRIDAAAEVLRPPWLDRGSARGRAGSRHSAQRAPEARRGRSRPPRFAPRRAAAPARASLWPRARAASTSAARRLIRRRAAITVRRLRPPRRNGRRSARAARWSSPTCATSWKKGETSPSSSRSMASSMLAAVSGAEAME